MVNTCNVKFFVSCFYLVWWSLLTIYLASSEPVTSCFWHSSILSIVFNSDHLAILFSLLFAFASGNVSSSVWGAVRIRSKLCHMHSTRWDPITLTRAHFMEENLLTEVWYRGADFGLLAWRAGRLFLVLWSHVGLRKLMSHVLSLHKGIMILHIGVYMGIRCEELVSRGQTVVRVVKEVDHLLIATMGAHGVEHNLSLIWKLLRKLQLRIHVRQHLRMRVCVLSGFSNVIDLISKIIVKNWFRKK